MATASDLQPDPTASALMPDAFYEIIDGNYIEKRVGADEIWIANKLHGWIFLYLREHRIGQSVVEMIFQMGPSPNRQRRPDLAFVSAERCPIDSGVLGPAWRVVPDLVAEVISPHDTFHEVFEKVEEYLQAGVRVVWLVSFQLATIWIYASPTDVRVLKAQDALDGGDVLPGFQLPLRKLFRNAPAIERTGV